MKNYIESGNVITITASAPLASGAGVLIGDLLGVTIKSAAAGDDVACCLTGVHELPKAAGAISQGARIYWDDTAKDITTTSAGNKQIGFAFAAAQNADPTVLVLLPI